MSDDQMLLFQKDIKQFWEIVKNDDSKVRFDTLRSQGVAPILEEMLLCEVIRYGFYNQEDMIAPLAALYQKYAVQMPKERRYAIFRHVSGFVEHTSAVSVKAFLPFIAEDDDLGIVSTAVIDYVSLGPLSDDDPMSRVKDIIRMIESGMLENDGAAFGAVLNIGDKRACDLLIPLRDSLDHVAISNVVDCSTGFMHSSTANFYLDWLEGLAGTDQDGDFGLVAAGLGLLKKRSRTDQVFIGHRPFPTRGATPEQWKATQTSIPLSEYLQRSSRRMYALERAEPPPRIMPHALTEWGLKPLTDPAETGVLKNRAATTATHLKPEIIPGDRIVDVKHEWWDGEGNIFLTWGILNPNGPTLYVLGSRIFDGRHRTFFRWLHMFGGCTTYAAEAVDEITYQGIYDDAVSIHEHLIENHEHGLFHIVPSFLIANGGDETLAAIAKRLLGNGKAAKNDWGQPMAYTRQFGSNFFGRAGAEIRETYEKLSAEAHSKGEEASEFLKMTELRYGQIPDFKEAKIPSWAEMSMTPELLEEWWQIVSPTDFQIKALAALRTMWEGAPKVLSDEMAANVVPWEPVMRFVEGYGLSLPK